MDFIKHVISNPAYLKMRERLDDEQRKVLDEKVVEMLEGANTMHMIVQDIFSTESGAESFSQAVEKGLGIDQEEDHGEE